MSPSLEGCPTAELPVALTATGDTVDTDEIDIEWEWWSTSTDVFTVEPGGLATAHNPGEAFCVVEATVEISQNVAKDLDIHFAGIGFHWNKKDEIQTESLELLPEIDFLEIEMAAVKKNKLRFGGLLELCIYRFGYINCYCFHTLDVMYDSQNCNESSPHVTNWLIE